MTINRIRLIMVMSILSLLTAAGWNDMRATVRDKWNGLQEDLCGDSIQYRFITKALDEREDKLSCEWFTMLSLRAFGAWVERVVSPDCQIVVFKLRGPDISMGAEGLWRQATDSDMRETDSDDSLMVSLNKEYVSALPFESYPQYACCDFAKLLSGNYIPVNIFSSIALELGMISVRLEALIPENMGSPTFRPVTFYYRYVPLFRSGEGRGRTPGERLSEINRELENGEITPEQWMTMYQEMHMYEWKLSEIDSKSEGKVTYTADNLPASVLEMFGPFLSVKRIKERMEDPLAGHEDNEID